MKVEIGPCTLYCGDCREILPALDSVDAVVTDPPWGLGALTGTTSKQRNRNAYLSHEDTVENIERIVIPGVVEALKLAGGRGLITPGVRAMWLYPRPRNVGGFYQPAVVGMSSWGFAAFNPVLFYGKDPRDGKGQSATMTTLTERASTTDHPCAKPLGAMLWMVEKASLRGELILDPFMGSGTTGIACIQTERRFVGIEKEPRYFDLARQRIEAAWRLERSRLPMVVEPVVVQPSLFD